MPARVDTTLSIVIPDEAKRRSGIGRLRGLRGCPIPALRGSAAPAGMTADGSGHGL
jgi:hypothetical protein